MKKISILLTALAAVFCISCSNDPKIEADYVKAVDDLCAKFESATTLSDIMDLTEEMSKLPEQEGFKDLRNTGAAKEATEKLEKVFSEENLQKKMSSIDILGGDSEEEETSTEGEEATEETAEE